MSYLPSFCYGMQVLHIQQKLKGRLKCREQERRTVRYLRDGGKPQGLWGAGVQKNLIRFDTKTQTPTHGGRKRQSCRELN